MHTSHSVKTFSKYFTVDFRLKTSRAPRTAGDPWTVLCYPKKFGSQGRILLNLGNGPVRDPENTLGRERGSFLSVWVPFYGPGPNFDNSEMKYINIHQRIKEMITNNK